MNNCAYIFLDEAGNFDFGTTGTRYFVLTSVSTQRPFLWFGSLDGFKYDCIEYGLEDEYFHCANDNRHVRGRVFVITDTIPVNRKRRAIERGIQGALATMLPSGMKYRMLHHNSRSHYGLQVADYCCWAIHRKWQTGESGWFDHIKPAVRSESDIFREGQAHLC